MRHRRLRLLCGLIVLVVGFCPLPTWANLLTNGSFEEPPRPDGYEYVPGDLTTIPGWRTILSGVERFDPHIYGAGAASDGSLALDLNTDVLTGGGIEQTIPTAVGLIYLLSFDAGTWLNAGRYGNGHIEVVINGIGQRFTVTNPTPSIVWQRFTVTFQATTTETTIAFQNFDSPEQTFSLLDNVSVLPCALDNLCAVDAKDVFLAATGATAATGIDATGAALPLPDLGAVYGPAPIGAVTFLAPRLYVGTAGQPDIENNDWTLLLDGPDIALTGSDPVKQLDVSFAQPVFAAGFEFVQPQNGPNVGPRFSDATFTVELKAGHRTIRELAVSPPNDVPTFIGMWADVAFDNVSIRSLNAWGTKVFGKAFTSTTPVLFRQPDIVVVDQEGGPPDNGLLFRVSATDGSRTLLSDLGDTRQGQPAGFPAGVAVEADGKILVIDRAGVLIRVDTTTGLRLPVSNFRDSTKGPLGNGPNAVAVEANGNVLVTDKLAGTDSRGSLFRVNPKTGQRTRVTDFGQGSNLGEFPLGVAVEANGNILVIDPTKLFRVTPGGN